MKKMTFKVNVNGPYFQYDLTVSHDAYLVQIWWYQPKSVTSYRTDKPNFLEFQIKIAKMTLKVTVDDPYFQYHLRVSHDACLIQIWWLQPKSVMSYHADKPNFLEFYVKMAKMTMKIKVNNPYFQYKVRLSSDACLVQIWWFQLKSVTSYRADKVKFMDGRTDGQTQATTIPLWPERPWGKKPLPDTMFTQIYVTIWHH